MPIVKDPLQVVQLAYQVELYHDLAQQLRGRSPRSSEAPNYWEKIIWVGHSYGSITGTSVSAKYPEDADIFVQSGIAVPDANQLVSLAPLLATYAPAAEFDPARFPASAYPAGYVTFSVKKARREYVYTRPLIDFDPVKVDKEFATEGTTTWGEALGQGFTNSTRYDKPVFVMTGQEDAVFCANSSGGSSVADCGSGPESRTAAMKIFYPAVPTENFEAYLQPNAGHAHQIHYSAPIGFAKVQAFLNRHGF
ncbi:MAG: hypothetical protein Q9214_003677 [Letrouitia sp. 1 TL-2023]